MTPERWQELKKVLGTALELDPAERSAYLDRACPEPSVRTEVESLIAAHDKGDTRFLDQPSVKLKQGTKLGPYEIVALVGAGGMGEVYRARDTRLNRIVAIKVLPSYATDRNSMRERFEREAKAISSLNHPHICTLYDVGHQDGIDYLVMEYVEGETLSARLEKGPLPLDQVLKYGIEIADALDKAHRKGITHRDLKPGNIMLTKSGAKLLDFGLAKLTLDGSPSEVPLSQLPTVKDAITAHGVILGTLQYMAPEQVEGKQIDARTDIFAFGAVVYEMATGKKAFEGKTQASLIAKILETDPPALTAIQPMTPPSFDRLVKKCLAKDPERRWQSASDICDELKWIDDTRNTQATAVAASVPVARNWVKIALWAEAAVIACIIVGVAVWTMRPASPKLVSRFVIPLPAGQRLDIIGAAIAISPDGTRLVYAAGSSNINRQLYLRTMDGLDTHPIPGTEGAGDPFFSPDSQWVGFYTTGKLMKIPLNGGTPIVLSSTFLITGFRGASWNTEGKIALALIGAGVIEQISETGGNSRPLTRLEKGEIGHAWPDFLPANGSLLFGTAQGGNDTRSCCIT
jgi:tRNA A-37 threonylcarbamoyl transferase component Bud32